jgi:hypothetical protein
VFEPELTVDATTWLSAAQGAEEQPFLKAYLLYDGIYDL